MKRHGVRIKSFFLKIAGHNLHFELIGAGEAGETRGPVLLFLHEGLGSIGQWRDFPGELAGRTGSTALVYDRWGYGKSDPLTSNRSPEYLHEEALTSLPEIFQKLKLKDTVLIGHSDGGSIALMFAAVHGSLVRAVITEAAHVFVEEITVAGIRRAVEAYRTTDLKKRLGRYHGGNTEGAFRGWADTWLSSEFRNWNIEEYLPAVTCPVLAIQGADDEYGSAEQVRAIISQVKGPARGVLIPQCGHIPHLQCKARVLNDMADFIASVS